MSAPITGVNGSLQASAVGGTLAVVPHTSNISFKRISEAAKYRDNTTAPYKGTASGGKDWNGSFKMALPDGSATLANASSFSFAEGDLIAIQFITATGKTASGNCRVMDIDVAEDIANTTSIVEATVTVEGDGALTISG